MEALLPVYTNLECAHAYGYFYMDYRVICAGEPDGINPCYVCYLFNAFC